MLHLEQLELCNSIIDTIVRLKENLRGMSKPIITDLSLIEPIHKAIEQELTGKPRSIAKRVELIILLYLFNPMLLTSRKHETNGSFKEISRVMNIEMSNLSKYKTNLIWQYNTYREFRELTNAIYDKILLKLKENSMFDFQ